MTDIAGLAAGLVDELLHHYARGRTTIAFDALTGPAAAQAGVLADAAARELVGRGVSVRRVSLPTAAERDTFRHHGLPAFRTEATAPADAVLVVDGAQLHANGLGDVWNLSVWVVEGVDPEPSDPDDIRYLREVDPPRRADVIIDVSDPQNPQRRFSDWCAVPKRR